MMKLRTALQTRLENWRNDLAPEWADILKNVEPDFSKVPASLTLESTETIFPGRKGLPPTGARIDSHIFRALDDIPLSRIRAVILGQDPYPKVSRATGRSFEQGDLEEWSASMSVVAESLRRIIQALAFHRTGDKKYLTGVAAWTKLVADIHSGQLAIAPIRHLYDTLQSKGVICLNAGLTISRFEAPVQKAHIAMWRPVVQAILQAVATRNTGSVVFLLWGKVAQDTFKSLK